jgi:uncharacterized protein (TIGR02147 family)
MNTMVKHIQNIFSERCRANEQYSLRAYARNLNVPVSSLSEIINGKRPLTKNICEKIGKALNMSPEQIEFFSTQKSSLSNKSTTGFDYRQIALDSFYIISEWHHYGILQLMRTVDFVNDSEWIAKRLNIENAEVELAMIRLIRVGIVEVLEDGQLVDTTEGRSTHLKNDFTNEQLRNFQIKALENAIHSLRNTPIEYRDNTSMTLAISKKALPFAKEEIKKFRRQLTKKLEAFDEPDEVYQLAIAFIPLSNIDIQKTGVDYETI